MKIKSLWGLGACGAVTLSLAITLPLVLASCGAKNSASSSDENENPIRFCGTDKPVYTNQEVIINANVANSEN